MSNGEHVSSAINVLRSGLRALSADERRALVTLLDDLSVAASHLMGEIERVGHSDYGADCHICHAIETVKRLRGRS